MILEASRLSFAANVRASILLMNSAASALAAASLFLISASVAGEGIKGGVSRGDCPVLRMKGEKPVDEFSVFMIWKRTQGNTFAHPFWFHSMWNCSD